MTHRRLAGLALGALLLAVAGLVGSRSYSQTDAPRRETIPDSTSPAATPCQACAACEDAAACRVYALNDLSDDAEFGAWLVATIPAMIEPASWLTKGGTGKITCAPQGRAIVVLATPTVHARVALFLAELRRATPASRETASRAVRRDSQVVPAVATVSAPTKLDDNVVPSYPVARPVQQPKHLFHFIIRYEGDGIIDSNVVEFMKLQAKELLPAAVAPAKDDDGPPANSQGEILDVAPKKTAPANRPAGDVTGEVLQGLLGLGVGATTGRPITPAGAPSSPPPATPQSDAWRR